MVETRKAQHRYAGRVVPTPRQESIVKLVCKGLTNKEIGDKLGLQEKTVKFHLTRIFLDFSVTSRTQLVLKVIGDKP